MRTISDLSVWAFVSLSVGCAGQDLESRVEQPEDPPATAGVVADLFELRWELLEGNQTLVLAIETDLPEDAEVLVSVDRTYYTLGDAEAYSQEYYSERGKVRHWQQSSNCFGRGTLEGRPTGTPRHAGVHFKGYGH